MKLRATTEPENGYKHDPVCHKPPFGVTLSVARLVEQLDTMQEHCPANRFCQRPEILEFHPPISGH